MNSLCLAVTAVLCLFLVHLLVRSVPGYNYLATLPDHPYPPGYRDYQEEGGKTYPFSGYFRSLPTGTLGSTSSRRSIAVGSRSVLTHAVSGADISIEGYTRSLKPKGTLAVIDLNKTRKSRTYRR